MKPRAIVLLLALLALVAKLYCAATTIGSSDVFFFFRFAGIIHSRGLIEMYKETPFFNHTPLVGWFSELVYTLSRGERPLFVFDLRLPAIFADFFGVIALLWYREKTGRPSWWALGVYAASPVGFMVSGYHGNVDSVMALAVLLAGLACALDRPILCGLCLGVACNVKIIPLMLAPAFLFVCWQRRQTLRFLIPAALTILIGWSYPLFTIPGIFLRDVLGYGSIWGVWGLTYILRLTGHPALRDLTFSDLMPLQHAIVATLKVVIVVLALVLAWRGRNAKGLEIFRTLSLIWAVFFVFAPGYGAQYLAWFIPCFLLADEKWFAWAIGSSSVALFVFYNAISHGMPWREGFTVHSIAGQWAPAQLLPWLVLTAFLTTSLRKEFSSTPASLEDARAVSEAGSGL